MEAIAALHFGRSKRLHLVRHAQGRHNLEAEKSRDPLTSFEYFDAELSSLGWQQVYDKRKHVCSSGLLERIEVVITSPMSRENMNEIKEEASANTGLVFPKLIFHWQIENEDDILWKAGEIETHEEVRARGMKFFQWLWARKEKEIAVVSHGVFLEQAMIQLINNNVCDYRLIKDNP
ncbi:hypothetical protein Goshw_002642, partial [Gossypium schwendimanii]|nr:hypothetical protein [Gossypium schwendimanii]